MLLAIEICDEQTGMPFISVLFPGSDTVVVSDLVHTYVDRVYAGDVSDLASGERCNVDANTMTEEA